MSQPSRFLNFFPGALGLSMPVCLYTLSVLSMVSSLPWTWYSVLSQSSTPIPAAWGTQGEHWL